MHNEGDAMFLLSRDSRLNARLSLVIGSVDWGKENQDYPCQGTSILTVKHSLVLYKFPKMATLTGSERIRSRMIQPIFFTSIKYWSLVGPPPRLQRQPLHMSGIHMIEYMPD